MASTQERFGRGVITDELRSEFRSDGWWGDRTFFSFVEEWSETAPQRLAVVDDVRQYTWTELHDAAVGLAAALRRLGVGPGDVVAAQLSNRGEFVIIHLAAELVGAVFTALTMNFRQHELRQVLDRAAAKVLFVEADGGDVDLPAIVASIRPELRALEHVVAVGAPNGDTEFWRIITETPQTKPSEFAETRLGADDVYALLISGGTTSALPKLSMRTQNSLIATLRIYDDQFRVEGQDRLFTLAPITQGTGYALGVLYPIVSGASMAFTRYRPGTTEFARRLDDADPTVLTAVPALALILLDAPEATQRDWTRLRLFVNGGAPMPVDVAGRIETLVDAPIVGLYGATDGMLPVCARVIDPPRLRHGTVGHVAPGHQVIIADENGDPLPPHQTGEVWARGPTMACGYFLNESETQATWHDDGWWHSGDMGFLDTYGLLHVVGRKKSMILRGGTNINPLEIEEILYTHPAVREAAVVGMPDPTLGERICAFVSLRPSGTLSLEEIRDHFRAKGIARDKHPERLEIRSDLTKSGAGKIRIQELAQDIARIVSAEREQREQDQRDSQAAGAE